MGAGQSLLNIKLRPFGYRRVREAVEMLVGNADVDISVYLSTSNYLCKFKVAAFNAKNTETLQSLLRNMPLLAT